MLPRLPIIVGLVLLSACRDANAPRATLHVVASGDSASGTVAGKEAAVYRTGAKAGAQLAIYLDAGPNVVMTLINAGGTLANTVYGATDLAGNTVTRVIVTPQRAEDAMYDIEIAAPNATQAESYGIHLVSVDRRPEHATAALSPGVIVQESIDHMADIDEFTFDGEAGQQIELYLRQLGPAATSGISATLFGERTPATQMAAPVGSAVSSQDLEQGSSGRITLPYAGHYRVVIQGPQFALTPYSGAYQLEYLLINAAPEQAPAAIVVGDTITEAIDHVGDFDDFVLTGAPGAEFNLFLDASGSPPHTVVARISELNRTLSAAPRGPTLLENGTGRFALPPSGRVTIHVAEPNDRGNLFRGPYRLFVAGIDRGPEGAPPLITPGGPAVSGAMDVPGDVDEYSFNLPAPATLNLLFTVAGPVATGMGAAILRGSAGDGTVASLVVGPFNAAADSVSTSHLTLPAGAYRVRVEGGAWTAASHGAKYQIELRLVDANPETAAPQIAIGDTVRTESLETAGDIDTFVLTTGAADTFNIRLATPGRANPGIDFAVVDPLTGAHVANSQSTSSLADSTRQTGRLAIDPGQYRVVVQSFGGGETLTQRGQYQLTVERASARPEHHAAVIALGDTIRDERIDYIGDYDDFIVHEPAGTELFAMLMWINDPQSTAFANAALAILDSASGAVLEGARSFGGAQNTRVTVVPASGVVRIRVQSVGDFPGVGGPPGGYWMTTQALNRAPESRPALFALGDTVADAVRPGPDVDEFVFAGSAGQSVDLFFQTPHGLDEPGFIELDLIDLATNAVLATLTSNNPTANLEDINRRGIVLPSTGSYRVRVQSVDGAFAEGDYRFRVAPSP
jgi:hypothetical protein